MELADMLNISYQAVSSLTNALPFVSREVADKIVGTKF